MTIRVNNTKMVVRLAGRDPIIDLHFDISATNPREIKQGVDCVRQSLSDILFASAPRQHAPRQ
jgi:hypothetical protein